MRRPSVTEAVKRKAFYEAEVMIAPNLHKPIPGADRYVKALTLAQTEVKVMYLLGMVDVMDVQEEIYRHYHAHLDEGDHT